MTDKRADKRLPGGSTVQRIGTKPSDTGVYTPNAPALGTTPTYVISRSDAAAAGLYEDAPVPEVVRGSNQVYVGRESDFGRSYTDYINGRGRYSNPVMQDADEVKLNWLNIQNNPAAMENLRQIYNIRYRKEPDYQPSPYQLQGMYDSAVNDAATAAANDQNVTVSDILRTYGTYDIYGNPYAGSGGGGGSAGPSEFVTHANEEDVRLLANGLAEEMIGRTITDDEFKRMYKRVRKAEKKAPRVVSVSGKTQVTETGITDAERADVMAEILREKPEWEQYQMTHGVLDAMNAAMQETGVLDSGI